MRISDWSSDVCSSDLGQAVRLGMDEAVAWHANQALAEGEGTSEAAGEKLGVDSDCLVAGEHTRGDQRVAVEEGCRPIAALGVAQPHQATRRHRLGGGIHLHLVDRKSVV